MDTLSHLHPMTVHFPIAFIIIGFSADVLGLFAKKETWLLKAGFYLMLLGTVSALVAYLTGAFFTPEFTGYKGELEERHELFAKITMAVLFIGTAFRIFIVIKKLDQTTLKWFVFFFYALATVSIAITGLLGGTLVYNYMIKV
jgi:uncharacterized membrane protein